MAALARAAWKSPSRALARSIIPAGGSFRSRGLCERQRSDDAPGGQAAHDVAIRQEFARQAAGGYGTSGWYGAMKLSGQLEFMLENLPLASEMRVLDVAAGTAI